MSKNCYISGAGESCDDITPSNDDYIIAADGGYSALKRHGIAPDLIVGDFDSLPASLYEEVLNHPGTIRSSVEKDDTDMMLAVRHGLEFGCDFFVINGGMGGRLDQTLANIQILSFLAKNGARGTLVGSSVYITAIMNSELAFKAGAPKGTIISIFSAESKAEGVTLKGLKYPLTNATVTNAVPIGVSNEFTGKPAVVSVKNGILIIMYEKDIGVIF
jgi:thiamine pyrophosphokinase